MAFSTSFRVRWVDTDIAGVMHYSNFFRYFEACEQEFYRHIGPTHKTIRDEYGIMLPRVEAHCEYKAPCHFDDLIDVNMEIRKITDKTITYDFEITRENDGKLAAKGFLKCIAVDLNWKVVPLPAELVKAIHKAQE